MTLQTGLRLVFIVGMGVMIVILGLALQTRRTGPIQMSARQKALAVVAGGLAVVAGGLAMLI